MSGRRLLLCGPAFPTQSVDGLQDVLRDLTAGLRARGWLVDTLLWPEDFGHASQPMPAALEGWPAALARTARAMHLPDSIRLAVRIALHDSAGASQASAVLTAVERRIATGRYDAVLALLDMAPVGLASLVTRAHPRTVLISLSALGRELRGRRLLEVVRRHLGGRFAAGDHRNLFTPVDPTRIRHAVFASDAWRDEAVEAGLCPSAAVTTHFGVPCPGRLEEARPSRSPARLLWAARLSQEKGLHVFLPALAQLRADLPFHLTVVAGPGTASYRARIDRLLHTLELERDVTVQAPVDRSQLSGLLAEHDVLLFTSPFRAPVAQMLLHAFANGLVVVGPASRDLRSILQPDRTAFCFEDCSPPQVAAAIRRAVVDLKLRRTVRAAAFELARTSQSLDVTISRYDELLTRLIDERVLQAG
jgi:glycosyltransferase involved in cell wall biosynthesis